VETAARTFSSSASGSDEPIRRTVTAGFDSLSVYLRPPRAVAMACGIKTTANPDLRSGRKYLTVPRNRDVAGISVD
jgi:hypothetical protein